MSLLKILKENNILQEKKMFEEKLNMRNFVVCKQIWYLFLRKCQVVFRQASCCRGNLSLKKENHCKCLCFKVKNIHNHLVEGGDSSKWHKVSHETKKLFENYFERKLSPPPVIVEHEKYIWTIFGKNFTFSKKEQCMVLIL